MAGRFVVIVDGETGTRDTDGYCDTGGRHFRHFLNKFEAERLADQLAKRGLTACIFEESARVTPGKPVVESVR
jgi:hypothetical protein